MITCRTNCSKRFITPDNNKEKVRGTSHCVRHASCYFTCPTCFLRTMLLSILSQFTKNWTVKPIKNKDKNTTSSPQQQGQNSFTSAKNGAKYLKGGHRHRRGNFSAFFEWYGDLPDLHRRFFLQVVTTHSTNALTRTRARLSFLRYQNWRHSQLFVMFFWVALEAYCSFPSHHNLGK
jgi:hypothetical protein